MNDLYWERMQQIRREGELVDRLMVAAGALAVFLLGAVLSL